MSKIKIAGLADAIMKEMNTYANASAVDVKECVKSVSKEGAKELKATSPSRTKKYAKGWTTKTEYETATSVSIRLSNKRYQVTHLLENGHAKRGGGRVRAIPHIKPVELNIKESLESKIKEVL